MMLLNTTEDLKKLHETILKLREEYKPPKHLMTKVNDEYRKYMESGDYYTWLALATRLLKPKRILELGNLYGASTIMFFSEIGQDTEWFTSVDLVKNIIFVPNEIIEDPRVTFRFGNDLNLNIYDNNLPTDCDFLFIDTLHERKHLEYEWSIYKNFCTNGCVVVLDDIYLDDIQTFWKNLSYPKLDISEDCHPSGFGVFLYRPSGDEEQTLKTEHNQRIRQAYQAALDAAYRQLDHRPKSSVTKRAILLIKASRKKIKIG